MGSEEGLLLVNSIESKDLYKLLIQQINKDANLAGIDLLIKESDTPKELVNSLFSCVSELFTKQKDTYLNFLYRVDVPEPQLQVSHTISSVQFCEKITYLILKREWQKVFIRSKNL